jgi:HAMP domain-containing protein
MGLRWKFLSGFFILSAMLLLAGVWSIHQMRSIGASVQRILDENYRSIEAAKTMMESLEREDSAVLLLLLGKWDEGRALLDSADASFTGSLNFAEANTTIPGEEHHLARIDSSYAAYKDAWIRPIVGTKKEGDLDWYYGEVHPAFLAVKEAVNALLALNDDEMYETASALKDNANRAAMPGIVAVLSGFIFSLIFTYFVQLYVIGPLIRITDGVQNFADRQKPFDVKVETKDELGRLASALQTLCSKVRSVEDRE